MLNAKTLTHSLWIPSKKAPKAILFWLAAMMTLLAVNAVQADTFYSKGATGDPTVLANWTNSANANPANFTSGDTFIILNGCNFTIPTATTWTVNATTTGTAATVQINSGGTLTFTLGTSSNDKLALGGNFVQNGTVAGTATTSTGTIEFTSNGAWTGSGDLSSPKINVQVDAGVTLDASGMSAGFAFRSANTDGLTVNGTLNIGTQTINGSGGATTFATFGPNSALICANTGGLGTIKGSSATGTFYNFNSLAKLTLPTSVSLTFNGVAAQTIGFIYNNSVTSGVGTITTTASTNAVTGVGTSFTSALVGSPIFNSAGTFIGTVASVASTTSMTLAVNGAVPVTAGAWSYIPAAAGTITTTTSSTSVTGSGTSFTSALVGLALLNNAGTYIGSVASVASATSLTLKANAAVAVTGGAWSSMSSPTVNGLTFNNSVGVNLNQAITATNLTLTAGKVTGNVTMASGGSITGGSSTAYINGLLTVSFTTAPSSASFTFPVGTASAYSPISIANFTDSSTGTLTASATATQNPNQGSSGIDGTLYIARYWTLTGTGFSSPAYDFTGTFVAGDNINGANTASLIVQKWNGSSWANPTGNSSTSTTVTGTGFSTSFGQFAAGQALTTIPILDSTTKTAVTNTSATLGATLENNYSVAVTNYGIVWGTSASPTTSSNLVLVGSTTPTLGIPFTANATGLPAATTVYYRGYAINVNGQTGYSTNGSLITLANEPTTQASGVVCSTLQNGSIPISWTRGNGSKCIVLVSASSPVSSAPVDGTTYTANATYGSGTQIGSSYVAYLNTGTNVTLTGLSTSTTYYVAVYELNGSGGSENYLTVSPATGSQLTTSIFVTTLTWTGTVDTDWNKTGNWDSALIPDVGTAVVIPLAPANQPTYSNQMTAASFGTLTSAGTLNVNTNGFNSGALTLNNVAESGPGTGAKMYVGSGGVVNVSGAVVLTSNAWITVGSGGSLTASGALNLGVASSATLGSVGIVTNNGGTINVASTGINPGNGSLSGSTATSGNCLFVINGGTNNLGNVVIKRSTSTGTPAIGKDGLAIYGGQVTMSGLDVGNNSANSSCSALVAGGIVTNNGSVFVAQLNNRVSRFLQTGGLFVVTNLVNPNPTFAGSINLYSVTGGTNLVGGILFGPASSGAGNIFFTNSAVMYVGSQGINANSGITLAAALTDGSLLGASADWTGSVAMNLSGTDTFKTADLGGTPHNITYNGVLSGAGNLNITGSGILTLGAADTYSGSTLIGSGTLALGASGSLASPQIMLGSGTTFDVSALGGAYSPSAAQTISGFGTINGLVTATTGYIQPGSNSVTGTLTFGGGLAENGGVTNTFVLPGDKIAIGSGTTLSASGVNVVQITGALSAGADYTLFDYSGGSFSGSVANFTLTGAGVNGYLTNDVSAQAIKLHALSSLRAPTSVVWVGNSTANNWDAGVTTNWLNAGALDDFLTGDTAVFDNQGGVNPNVNIASSVSPALVVVNTSSNYVFTGTGSITGSGGITVSNGSLTIASTNSYTGPTVLAGGFLIISNIANGLTSSPIGAASVAAANVVFNGGTLDYFGPTASTDHGITLTNGGGVIDIGGAATLTLNGSIVGNGGLTKIDTGSLTLATASSYGGNTVVSNGVLTLNDASAAGSGSITLYGGNLKLGAVKPNNTVNVAGNAQVTGGNGSGNTGIKNVTGSANLLLAVTTGVFDLTGDMSTYSGSITFSNAGGGGVRFNGSKGSALATWDLGAGPMDLNERAGSTSNNIGALIGGSSTTLSGRGGSGNSGATTYYIGANGLNTIFGGVIQNGNGASGSTPSTGSPTSINKVGSGTLTLNGVSTFTGTAVVNGGALSGVGTISGATTFNAGTTLSAGTNGVGTLTFGGNLTLNAASTNSFAVTTVGGVSNSVTVSGTLNPNGSVIKITSGTSLAVGTYTLFNYTGISGSFNATPVFDVAPAATASIVDTGSGQINLVIATPGPSGPASITNSISGSTLSLTWPAGQGWRLVSQTNDLTTGLTTNWFTVPGVSDGSATITVDPTKPTVFYELVYP